jgi:1-deoxy-D-xylulose-5-phosphate reductoisomerase
MFLFYLDAVFYQRINGMVKKRVAVLGATGSIGSSALDVISRAADDFEVVLLSAHTKKAALEKLKDRWPRAVLSLSGKELLSAIADSGADITVNGISGAAGLEPSMAAIEAASSLALANKETIVMAGPLVLNRAQEKNVSVIPVDSEHSAVFHLLAAHGRTKVSEIILTASGGPFRNHTYAELENVSASEALAHPVWNMGPKITVDSASLANKGLEVIEAVRLFDMPPEKVRVVIHPQSVVHSMLRLTDGAVYAALSCPDMRQPIQQALYWPQSRNAVVEPLNFNALTLEFGAPDTEKFPMLALAYSAIACDGFYPCVYNSANETAVAAFLTHRICFLDIPRVTGYVLDMDWSGTPGDIGSITDIHRRAGEAALQYIDMIKE